MNSATKWDERYREGTHRWDLGREDRNLIRLVKKFKIKPCQALEIGCGMGYNAIWLAKQGFNVTAIDISETAIEIAKEKASDSGVSCRFIAGDFLHSEPLGKFRFVFDRGCFHSFDAQEERKRFAANVAMNLSDEGLWLSIIGNADDLPRDTGPPMRSAEEIISAVEPHFEILSLVCSYFDSNRESPAKSWELLCRKRNRNRYYSAGLKS